MSRRRKGHQHIPSMTYSDFEAESDIQYASDAPPPPTRTDTALNLSVLRRYDPSIISIQYICSYAVVYTFAPETGWEKSGVEGTAFLVQLSPNSLQRQRFSVMVLNRRGLENFTIEITSTEEVEITEEYIIFQRQSGPLSQIYGLWIFQEPEPASTARQRAEMAGKIVESAKLVEAAVHSSSVDDAGYDGGEEGEGSIELEGKNPTQSVDQGQGELAIMFQQQRAADDAWSVRSHSPRRQQQTQPPVQPQSRNEVVPSSQFTTSADTDFFLSARSKGKGPSSAATNQGAQSADTQKNILLDLFRKPGTNPSGA